MRVVRHQTEYLSEILALHRSAIGGFDLGMNREVDETDLMAI